MATKLQMQQAITTGILVAGRSWRRVAGRALWSRGTSDATAAALICIAHSGNGVRQIEIASQIGIESPSLVRLINQLEAQGLVERQCDGTDRRANGLWLTKAGQELAHELENLLIELRSSIFRKFTKADLETASRVLGAFENFE